MGIPSSKWPSLKVPYTSELLTIRGRDSIGTLKKSQSSVDHACLLISYRRVRHALVTSVTCRAPPVNSYFHSAIINELLLRAGRETQTYVYEPTLDSTNLESTLYSRLLDFVALVDEPIPFRGWEVVSVQSDLDYQLCNGSRNRQRWATYERGNPVNRLIPSSPTTSPWGVLNDRSSARARSSRTFEALRASGQATV